MKGWIRQNRVLAGTFDGNFEGFLNLAIRETSDERNAVGYFRSCHISIEEMAGLGVRQEHTPAQDLEEEY